MGDSVDIKMPDTSVFGAILSGNAQVAQELEQLRANGETIVVPGPSMRRLSPHHQGSSEAH